jgi:hypothetical protein
MEALTSHEELAKLLRGKQAEPMLPRFSAEWDEGPDLFEEVELWRSPYYTFRVNKLGEKWVLYVLRSDKWWDQIAKAKMPEDVVAHELEDF